MKKKLIFFIIGSINLLFLCVNQLNLFYKLKYIDVRLVHFLKKTLSDFYFIIIVMTCGLNVCASSPHVPQILSCYNSSSSNKKEIRKGERSMDEYILC